MLSVFVRITTLASRTLLSSLRFGGVGSRISVYGKREDEPSGIESKPDDFATSLFFAPLPLFLSFLHLPTLRPQTTRQRDGLQCEHCHGNSS